MTNPNKDKTCFIITPIGDEQSDIRRAADGVIDAVIIPALEEVGFNKENILAAHRMPNPGSINTQVITSILECDIAIANLTTLNPNVMYELAVRHAVRKPVIQICQKGTRLPFDITEQRTILYTDDMKGVIELTKNFKEMVINAIDEKEPDNPIYRVIQSNTIMQNVKETDPSRYVLEHMNRIEKRLADLTNVVNSSQNGSVSINAANSVNMNHKKRTIIVALDESQISKDKLDEILEDYESDKLYINFKVDYINSSAVIQIIGASTGAIENAHKFIMSLPGIRKGPKEIAL